MIKIELDEKTLKSIIRGYVQTKFGETCIDADKIIFEVKSKQNYKSEWEQADFRMRYEGKL